MKLKKYILSAAMAGVASGLLFTGCVEEDLLSSVQQPEMQPEQASLVLDLNLAAFGDDSQSNSPYVDESEHGEAFENHIAIEGLRLFFCDLEGNYLFEANWRNIIMLDQDKSLNSNPNAKSKAYRLIVPRNELIQDDCGDPVKEARHNEAIRKAIYEDGFKVAVLANWPREIEGKRDKDPETEDEYLGTYEPVPQHLGFEWFDDDPDGDGIKVPDNERPRESKIGYLSQCVYDNVYGEPIKEGSTEYSPSYEHLVFQHDKAAGKGQMGLFTSWVSHIYKNQNAAAEFIRKGENDYSQYNEEQVGTVEFTYGYKWEKDKEGNDVFTYKPYSYTRKVDHLNEYKMENIMRLWNFSAGAKCPYHGDMGTNSKNYWENRNKYALIAKLKEFYPDASVTKPFEILDANGDLVLKSNLQGTSYDENNGFLKMTTGVNTSDVTTLIPKIDGSNKTQSDKFINGSMMFRAYGEGVLRIRASAAGSGKIAVMTRVPNNGAMYMVKIWDPSDMGGQTSKAEGEKAYIFTPKEAENTRDGIPEVEFMINPDSREYLEVYVATVDGTVNFYEMEYIRSRHIYDSERNAIMPSRKNAIPMYGMQNFDPIGKYIDVIPDNGSFNLSDESYNWYLKNNPELPRYNYKNIYMLRSLAKVELRFKKSVFKNNPPQHVFMRVMNRTARCEPMDVINPTDWIWYGNDGFISGDGDQYGPENRIDEAAGREKFAGAAQEFQNIMDYYDQYPLYTPGGSYDIPEYLKRTAWFHGFWSDSSGDADNNKYYWQIPWDWNNMITNSQIPAFGRPYPRIFNTRIDRSDYCRFHEMADDGEYIRFVMYVPEKNITDTDTKGDLSATPKVQHIEVRFADMNGVMNFDDNLCYRIYFTNYSNGNGQAIKSQYNRDGLSEAGTYNDFEKDMNWLKELQPIMRNCHYIFTINSINDEQLGVNMSVCGAATRNSQKFVIN